MDWKKILDRPEGPDRDREFAAALKELAFLDEGRRAEEARRLIESEYSHDEEDLRQITFSRLRALLSLDDGDAQKAAETYDTVMNTMPGDIAFRRAAVDQTVARYQFSVEDEARLRSLMPNVFGEKPAELSVETPGPQEPVQPYPKKRWSFFWWRKKAEAAEDANEVPEDVARRMEQQRSEQSPDVIEQYRRNRPVI